MSLVRLEGVVQGRHNLYRRRLVAFELVEVEQMDLGNALEV